MGYSSCVCTILMRVLNILGLLCFFEQCCQAEKAQIMTGSSPKRHRPTTMKNVTEGESMPTFMPKYLLICKQSRNRLKLTLKRNLLLANLL